MNNYYLTPLTKIFQNFSKIILKYLPMTSPWSWKRGLFLTKEFDKIYKGRKTFQPQQAVSLDIKKFLNSY